MWDRDNAKGVPAMQPMQARWTVTARRWRSVLTVVGPDHRAGEKTTTPHVVVTITTLED